MAEQLSEKQKLEQRLLKDLQKHGNLVIIAGAFGDIANCEGVAEERIHPPEGGTLTKLYGCSYLFKGYPSVEIVEGNGLAKAMISVIPRDIIGKSIPIMLAFGVVYSFMRKKFWHLVNIYISTIYFHGVYKLEYPENHFNKMTREIKRASNVVLDKMLKLKNIPESKVSLLNYDYTFPIDTEIRKKREFIEIIAKLIEFICLFLEFDNAYRFRIQDVFGEIDKVGVMKSISKEFNRIMRIGIYRENKEIGITYKWKFLKVFITLVLFFDKDIRYYVKELFLELNLEQVKLDEDDWYFCLNRIGYDFKGWTYENRIKEKKRIDKEKGHFKVQPVNYVTNEEVGHKKELGIKVMEYE